MKILNATRFEGIVETGGSTKPWKVFLLDGVKEVSHIVKLFSPHQTEQQMPVAKEVICSVLAKHLGLFTPDFALARFSKNFIDNALSDSAREILVRKDGGLKFASQYVAAMSIFSANRHNNYLSNVDFANIFAFDCLIFNVDRRNNSDKTNLLVEDENYLLIDHELAFMFIDQKSEIMCEKVISEILRGQVKYPYTNHLLYSILKNSHKSLKPKLFLDFEGNLKKLDINHIRQVIYDLSEHGIEVGSCEVLIDYLHFLKEKSSLFCSNLLSCII